IGYSDKGYNTVELGLGWLKHFDKHTKRKLEPDNIKWQQDLFDENDSKDFLEYAETNGIIVLALLPHLIYKMQLLDIGVF
ncbi:hypothetical protein DL95DRAFT_297948, partial [Leptodontidium sp. 2 PMI_412]